MRMEEIARKWLAMLCQMNRSIHSGVIVVGYSSLERNVPTAIYPENTTINRTLFALLKIACDKKKEQVLLGTTKHREGIKNTIVAYPIFINSKLHGAVACEIVRRDEAVSLDHNIHLIKMSVVWLELLLEQNRQNSNPDLIDVIELIATTLIYDNFKTSTTAWVTELALQFSCSRVTYGLRTKSHSKVVAVSHSASFELRSNLISQIANAMDEAIDQDSAILFPVSESDDPYVTIEAEKLIVDHGTEFVCTIPVINLDEKRAFGAITLERTNGTPFDKKTINRIKLISALVGPILDLKYKNSKGIIYKLKESLKIFLMNFMGKEHLFFKVFSLCFFVMMIASTSIEGQYRVTANASLEGRIQRAVTSPIQGFISEVYVKAGDEVQAGELMATLNNKELKLERLTWASQELQYAREYREALAMGNRSQASISKAQLDQAKAQINLVDEKLLRTKLHAPFSGWIVSGDLSQSLGIPVERGQILFEIAPLNDYRIIFQVDERDIIHVKLNQEGHVVLSGATGEKLKFKTTAITPVSSIQNGHNSFRVEAHLLVQSSLIRPGMQGIGKIDIDQRTLLWIWTHRFVEWVQIQFWRWWP